MYQSDPAPTADRRPPDRSVRHRATAAHRLLMACSEEQASPASMGARIGKYFLNRAAAGGNLSDSVRLRRQRRSVGRAVGRSVGRSVGQSGGRAVGRAVGRSGGRSGGR